MKSIHFISFKFVSSTNLYIIYLKIILSSPLSSASILKRFRRLWGVFRLVQLGPYMNSFVFITCANVSSSAQATLCGPGGAAGRAGPAGHGAQWSWHLLPRLRWHYKHPLALVTPLQSTHLLCPLPVFHFPQYCSGSPW